MFALLLVLLLAFAALLLHRRISARVPALAIFQVLSSLPDESQATVDRDAYASYFLDHLGVTGSALLWGL
jgi:hypothetical protein